MLYDVLLEKDTNDTFLVTVPDFPEVVSVGDTKEEALSEVLDAIETAIQGRIADRELVPVPQEHRDDHLQVRLHMQASMKALLHNEMVRQGLRKADLGRLLGAQDAQVQRLLNVRYNSKVPQIEEAFTVLGKHLDVRVA